MVSMLTDESESVGNSVVPCLDLQPVAGEICSLWLFYFILDKEQTTKISRWPETDIHLVKNVIQSTSGPDGRFKREEKNNELSLLFHWEFTHLKNHVHVFATRTE